MLVIAIAALVANDGLAYNIAPTAPVGKLIDSFAADHAILSTILAALLFITSATILARATLRSGIYTINTLATMSLTAVILAITTHHAGMLTSLVVATLTIEGVARLLRCLKSSRQQHYLFTAMLAIGTLPLIDSALLSVTIIAPLLAIFVTHSTRGLITCIAGLLLPLTTYCYVMWCMGDSFAASATMLWNNMLQPSSQHLHDIVGYEHFIFSALILLAATLSLIYRYTQQISVHRATRHAWNILFATGILLSFVLMLLPSTSATSIIVIYIVVTPILPLFFQRVPTVFAILMYVILLINMVLILLK